MIKQLLLAFILTGVTVLVHSAGIVYAVLPLAGIWEKKGASRKIAIPVMSLTRLVSGLLILHLIEMTIWAIAFTALGVLSNFETSLYFSLKSYTTVGYGDVLPSSEWRLVGPIEAAVGVLMLGLSTGFIVAAVQRIYQTRHEQHTAEGERHRER
jgi:voltage-gated potassium channel Kch